MTLTLLYMLPPAYLLVGCLIMLVANELVHGSITRKEFLRGMLVWPLGVVYFLEFLLGAVLTRLGGGNG